MVLQGCKVSVHAGSQWVRLKLLHDALLVRRQENPIDYNRSLKWSVTLILAAASLVESLMVIILYPALPQVASDLHTTNSIGNLASTLCDIGPAIAPLYWSLLSEKVGRRPSCLLSISLFTLFTGLAGTSQNISALITFRVLGSFCGCAASVVGSAMVADMWEVKERGYAMSVFCLGLLCGTAIGPLLGGVLAYAWNWRAIQWFLTAYGAMVFVLQLLFLPETTVVKTATSSPAGALTAEDHTKLNPGVAGRRYGTTITTTSTTWSSSLRVLKAPVSIFSPLSAVWYLKFPAISLITYLSAISLVAIIVTFVSIQSVFSTAPYEFNYLMIGLIYLPMPLGMICGGLTGGKWADHIMKKQLKTASVTGDDESGIEERQKERKATIVYKPEDRLRENALLSTMLIPAMLLFYGWTVQYKLFWFVPVIPMFLMSFGTGLTFSLITTMLTEFIPHRSATMVALDSLVKNLFAAAGGSSAQPLINTIGNGWLFTALAGVLLFSVPIVLIYRRRGRIWREHIDQVEGIDRVMLAGQGGSVRRSGDGASVSSGGSDALTVDPPTTGGDGMKQHESTKVHVEISLSSS